MKIYIGGVKNSECKDNILLKLNKYKITYNKDKAKYIIYILTPKCKSLVEYVNLIDDAYIYKNKCILYINDNDDGFRFGNNEIEAISIIKDTFKINDGFITYDTNKIMHYIFRHEISKLINLLLKGSFIIVISLFILQVYNTAVNITTEDIKKYIDIINALIR